MTEAITEKEAFLKLIELSSHYARLLNQHDGGHRMTFKTPEEWIERLQEVEKSFYSGMSGDV